MRIMVRIYKFFLLIVAAALVSNSLADEYHHGDHEVHSARKKLSNEDTAYWMKVGQDLLARELEKRQYNSKAKNVILFLGDGMSIPTITAARIYKGQKEGNSGEENELTFDKFPYVALSRTYCVDSQVADSACSATAYLCGVKGNIDTVGVDSNVLLNDCQAMNNPQYQPESIMTWAQRAGKATGVVTTTPVTHATPAGSYAHSAHRDWMSDADVVAAGIDSGACSDIAEQLVRNEPGKNFKVILGGGRANFFPNTTDDVETGTGKRLDGADLVAEWKANRPDGVYVTSRDELNALVLSETESIFGLFSPGDMEYFVESSAANNPTLEEMTRTAIGLLQKEPNGFVLLVEGGRIDHAHHSTRAGLALEETLQFDLAIAAALEMTQREDTLIVVTADHAHTFSISGYPERGSDIFGFTEKLGQDMKPFTTLSYANGPSFPDHYDEDEPNGRRNLTGVDTADFGFRQASTVPLSSETHGGDDVAIFAIGPQAHMFQGVYQQNYIAHVIGYAACIGPGLCFREATTVAPTTSGTSASGINVALLVPIFIKFLTYSLQF